MLTAYDCGKGICSFNSCNEHMQTFFYFFNVVHLKNVEREA